MEHPYLEWTDPEGRSRRQELSLPVTVLGRRPGCDLIFTEGFVSGRHAELRRDGDHLLVVDLNSTNGTFVNGERILERRLRSGDRLGLGELQMTVHLEPPSGARTEVKASFPDLQTFMPPTAAEASDLEKLSLLLDLQARWGREVSSDHLLRQILRSALTLSGAERGFILLSRGEGGFNYASGLDEAGMLLPEERFRTSLTVVRQVASSRQPVFQTEGLEGDLAQAGSVMALNLRAVACLPLLRAGEEGDPLLGILYLDSTRPMHRLSGLDQRILGKLSGEAAEVLEKLEMVHELEEKHRIERDLQMAHQAQRALLPGRLPQSEAYALQAANVPTRYVGGDFYDFARLEGDRLVGLLADVSGKGVAASLLAASVQGALQMRLRAGEEPARAVSGVDRYLCERSAPEAFVTLFLFTLDPDGTGVCLNAGHNPPLIHRAATGGVESLLTRGMVLGAFPDSPRQVSPFSLQPGDLLLVYSDGLTEAQDEKGELFGEERLARTLRETAPTGAAAVQEALLAAVSDFAEGVEQADDITLIVAERKPHGAPPAGP